MLSDKYIMIVEGEQIGAKELRLHLLEAGHQSCRIVSSSVEAMECAAVDKPELILVNTGNLDTAKEISRTMKIPVVLLNHQGKADNSCQTILKEPFGFMIRSFPESEFPLIIQTALCRDGCMNPQYNSISKRNELYEKPQEILWGTINGLFAMVEVRDPYTAQHQKRVARLAREIAAEMNLAQDQIENIYIAGILHDIGKMKLPSLLLCKTGKLTDAELKMMKQHPQTGFEILKAIDFPCLPANIVYQHHELINGSGYPQGLKDEEILLEAKILCVADVTEAITNHRPYRPGMGLQRALKELELNRGKLYHNETVDSCMDIFRNNKFTFEENI
ncbi:MAG: HD domain-containing protein [Candidatus Cloacimonetes bacterium]|nr:HD domain-containing protein [Candidatus Cloacimonadota bacterium]